MIFIDFYWFLEPQEAGTPAAGWPPDGPRMARYCLGALLGRLGGRRQEKPSKNPFSPAKFGELIKTGIFQFTLLPTEPQQKRILASRHLSKKHVVF